MHARPRSRHELNRPVTFRPPRAAGTFTGAVLTAAAAIGAATVGAIAARSDPELGTAMGWLAAGGLGTAAVLFAGWTFSVLTLGYTIDSRNLVIRWGLRKTLISLSSIESVLHGRSADAIAVSGLNWWGCHVGSADIRRIGFTLVFATDLNPERLLFLKTTDESYALSVQRQDEFRNELRARQRELPPGGHPQHSTASGIAALPFWRDRTAMTSLLASVLACALVVGFVFGQYPNVAPIVEINFPGVAEVVRVGNKEELLGIAYLAAAILTVNSVAGILVHARARAAGLWLLGSSTLLQGVLLVAAILAFGRA